MSTSTPAPVAAPSAAPAYLPLPNCVPYLKNGFDPKTTSFMTSPIFDLTYSNGVTTPYGNQNQAVSQITQCSVPDQVTSYQTLSSIKWSSSQNFMRTISDYKYSFSVAVNAGLKGQKYSGSLSSSLTYSSNLFSDTSKEYFLSFRYQEVYTIERNLTSAQSSLNPTFAAALNGLPATISSASAYQQYAAFFQQYGTYFFVSGTFGGSLVRESIVSKSLIKSQGALAVTASIKGSFETEIGKVSGGASSSYNESNSQTQYQDQITSSLSSVGGIYDPNDLGSFFQSCFEAPVLLLGLGDPGLVPSILPLSALITGADATTRVETMDAAARVFLGTPHISGPDPVPLSTRISFPSDAILVGYTNYSNNGGRGYTTGLMGPEGVPPPPCAYASGHLYTNDDRYASRAGLAFPVPQGMIAELMQTTTYGTPPVAAFNAFKLGEADNSPTALGAPVPLSTAGPVTGTAATDGFLLISLVQGGDGARGTATVTVAGNLRGAASIHYYPNDDVHYRQESMLVPICNGEQYVLDYQTTFGTVTFAAQWIPLSGALAFQPAQQLLAYQTPSQNPQTVAAKAETDGILILVLDGRNSDGAQGYGTLQLSEKGSDLDDDATMAGTSIHFYPGADTWLPCNSATLPVPKGWSYQVTVSWSFDSFPVTAYWVPLVNPTDPTSYAS